MRVLFIQKDGFIKIGTMILSSVIKKSGHECSLTILAIDHNLKATVRKYSPDLIAFSCITGTDAWIVETADRLKEDFSIPIIVGGPHTTFFPDFINNKSIDFICIGEGEGAMTSLLQAMEEGKKESYNIKNIWAKTGDRIEKNSVADFIPDLDTIPFSDFSIYGKYRQLLPHYRDMYPVITGRGCPKGCSYCFNERYRHIYKGKGKYIRKRSPAHIIEEILNFKERYNIERVNFVDDIFLVNLIWLKEFAALYREKIALPCIINVEATFVTNENISLISDMGCIGVRMGLESGNEKIRNEILNKKISNEQLLRAAGIIKKHRLKLTTYNMLGIPGEDVDNALDTLNLNRKMQVDFAQCSILQPYPGTSIAAHFKTGGEEHLSVSESFFGSSGLNSKYKNEILNLQKLFQIFLLLNVPDYLVKKIIKLPRLKLFDLLFGLSYAVSKIRTNKNKIIPTIIMGIKSNPYVK